MWIRVPNFNFLAELVSEIKRGPKISDRGTVPSGTTYGIRLLSQQDTSLRPYQPANQLSTSLLH